ncbi:MAG: hypothetical protein PHY85_04430 [Bacteroidales bacterium]|nr:hypothetical protein [Bacteroidales bacterium]
MPLTEAGKIIIGNACRIDWEEVCPKNGDDEIYILGNPPYLGSSLQNRDQKKDTISIFTTYKIKKYKSLDYISNWFIKASFYLRDFNIKCAFVTTDSICQGQQVELLWPHIEIINVEIFFAHNSFKWTNNAKSNAGVSVVIIGLRNFSKDNKYLLFGSLSKEVDNINFYLNSSKNIIVHKRSKVLSNLPIMSYGNKAVYGEPLILEKEEFLSLVNSNVEYKKFLKKLIGAKELLDGKERWCIWVSNANYEEAKLLPELAKRFEEVKSLRLQSKDLGAIQLANRPYQFRDLYSTKTNSIVIPLTTSERRLYIPIGFTNSDEILTNSVSVIYNSDPSFLGILSSSIHLLWVKAVGGKLESRIRYSSVMCWNTFPFPQISTQRKNEITQSVFRILEEREKHSDKTLAQLYDPDKMPEGLREAHRINDIIIERCYRSTPFTSDEERLEYLFKLYEKMILEEKEQGTLFAQEKKTRKKKK